MVVIFGIGIDLDDILDDSDGQGHRSKVTRKKNVISDSREQIPNPCLWCDAMS